MKRIVSATTVFAILVLTTMTTFAQPPARTTSPAKAPTADLLAGLPLRGLGPMLKTGRVADLAIDPRNGSVWYVVVASGGLWKTVNRGATFTPIFDDGGSYSLGCLTIDPRNSDVLWLGTGENQSLRSASFGDGVYKSLDAGKTWKRVGLETSEHIAKILVDPRNSNVVFVASQGPLWSPGGDRGLFKTTDGGATWRAVLKISNDTGITDVLADPRNPDLMYAAAYQRRRSVGILIGGGPESGIHKSTDGGTTWKKITRGLPTEDTGRIALGLSPQNPDVVYALVAAARKASGFFRSSDRGETWTKLSDYIVVDPQYYGEIFPDPHTPGRIFAVDMTIHVTEDDGRTWNPWSIGIHSDHHEIEFDPADPKRLLIGNDGGLYESWDAGRTWKHFTNLPITQFYHLAVDDALPFYNVYGGAQDNGSMGGPSRTRNRVGIRTSDWINVGGGDGMQPRIEFGNPSIVYTQSQNGSLSRLDLRTGVSKGIRVVPAAGDPPLRWNWNAPLLISPHSASRLYHAANKLFRSDDRGESWKAVSPDLTRALDRDKIPVMGKVWGPDAVWKNVFTTDYGIITALDESPRVEGLLYAGTDEGLVQVSEDGGGSWRKVDGLPSAPAMTYVSDLHASRIEPDTVYATLNDWQRGNFKPYLLKSRDRGRTWTSIAGDLPDRHPVWSVVEDPVTPSLLFAGTEFGLFVTLDGGARWTKMKGNVPTIAFRDLEIQRREGDLIAATFGRGFYILDDYTPLRSLDPDALARPAALFPVRTTPVYSEIGYVTATSNDAVTPNPPFGALITYYLRDGLGDAAKAVLTIADAAGKEIRRIEVPAGPGLHRAAWDLRPASPAPAAGASARRAPQAGLVDPGTYIVTLTSLTGEAAAPLAGPQKIEVVPLPEPTRYRRP